MTVYEYFLNKANDIGFIPKNEIVFKEMANELGLSRQTISIHVKKLIEEKKLEKEEDGYIICSFRKEPQRSVEQLISWIFSEDVKVILGFLRENGRIRFTIGEIMRKFNFTKVEVMVILNVLQKLDFVKLRTDSELDAKAERIRTYYYIEKVKS